MYTNDVVIWTSTKNNAKQHKTLEQRINNALNSLSKWATENNMEINAAKTVYQFFSTHHKNTNFDLKINSQKLPKSESTKYLGVHMDNKLSWKNHVEHTINKANQRLKLIKQLARATWGSTQETMNTTYKTYIKPVMKYGSEVLITASSSTLKALETTQNNALRLMTGGVKTTPILALQL
jgi:acyl-homoserine lactone acylase PvdQ